jgi:hypothetical protein
MIAFGQVATHKPTFASQALAKPHAGRARLLSAASDPIGWVRAWALA